jgi:hypothetical protein
VLLKSNASAVQLSITASKLLKLLASPPKGNRMIRSKLASRLPAQAASRRARTMGIILGLLALLVHVVPGVVDPALGQGTRKDDIVFNSRGVPLAGATIRVCAMPATGQPCAPLANIYSDAALTQAMANPTTTDGLGNYFFYAAPGKYEIEISGPGITTKQIPNVILPSDPSSPTFNNLSTTGNISAFSLSLTGNLTVNGSTTVVGNLASGTLNLANQSVAPGAASPGTVNLYTKADKRLYYEDDTGTEIGPIANTSGAQTNVSNTFTAAQNFDADIHAKGPNPWIDVVRYGARAINPNTPPQTTAATTASSPNVTLAAASTFQNGDGITIYGAGAANTMTAPSAPTVTPSIASHYTGTGLVVNAPNGAATYNYKIIARDKNGGYTAASTAGTTTIGGTLGGQSVSLTSCSRSNATVTCITSTAHTLAVGAMVYIASTSSGYFDGWFNVATVPDNTHFTLTTGYDTRNDSSAAAAFSTGGTVFWWNCNHVTWSAVTGATQYYIYSDRANPGTFALIGASRIQGISGDLTFDDFGSPMMDGASLPAFIPTTAPTNPSNDNLTTTISNGAGTTSLVLAANAGTSVTNATTIFDDAPTILAAANAAVSGKGTLYFPAPANGSDSFVINSYLTLPASLAISQAGPITLNDTVQVGSSSKWYGNRNPQGGNTAQFGFQSNAAIGVGRANPGLYVSGFSQWFEGLIFSAGANLNATQQVLVDQVTPVTFKKCDFSSGSGNGDYMSVGLYIRGINTNTSFDISLQDVNFLGGPAQTPGLTSTPLFLCSYCGKLNMDRFALSRRGIFLRAAAAASAIRLSNARYQGGIMPAFGFASTNGAVGSPITISGVEEDTTAQALYYNGPTTNFTVPRVYLNGAGAPSSDAGQRPGLVTGAPVGTLTVLNPVDSNLGQNVNTIVDRGGTAIDGVYATVSSSTYMGRQVNAGLAIGSGYSAFVRGNGVTNLSCSTSAGGSVPVGTLFYAVVPIWVNGGAGEPVYSSQVNVTSGNQTVNCTWTPPPGNPIGYNAYRASTPSGGALINAGCSSPQFTGTSFSDTFSFTCGNGIPSVPAGGPSGMNASGVFAPKIVLGGEQFAASPRGPLNVFLPGALTSTWTGETWTLDKAITVTRVQVQAKTPPSGCTTNAVVRLTDGSTTQDVTISAAANDSGPITRNYAGGAVLTLSVQTAAAGCAAAPADANAVVQFRMQ